MKRGLLRIVCAICLILLFQIPTIAEGIAPSKEENIAGFPVIEETGPDTGKVFDWKTLPKEEKEKGFIENFAFDGGHRCAIFVNNKIMVFDETNCIFKCQFRTGGPFQLSFWKDDLILYLIRSQYFYRINLNTFELKEYRLDDTYIKGYEVSEALDLNPGDSNTENGFYVTNHLGNRTFKIGYDMLIYVKDGKPQTVYSSYTKIFCWIVFAVANTIAAIILLQFYRKKKKQKRTGDGCAPGQ